MFLHDHLSTYKYSELTNIVINSLHPANIVTRYYFIQAKQSEGCSMLDQSFIGLLDCITTSFTIKLEVRASFFLAKIVVKLATKFDVHNTPTGLVFPVENAYLDWMDKLVERGHSDGILLFITWTVFFIWAKAPRNNAATANTRPRSS